MAMVAAAAGPVQCCRCLRYGHSNKECDRPYFRVHTDAELRQLRLADREKRRQEWESRQAEKAKKQEDWEAGRAAWQARGEAAQKRPDGKGAPSELSADTRSTSAESVVIDQQEVMRLASQDKLVRKLEKVLRDIERLEEQEKLDILQLRKISKKPEVVIELDTARGLAASRVRAELRKIAVASVCEDGFGTDSRCPTHALEPLVQNRTA
eukprot:TRINITY_DN10412_c0_g1_i1.p1 TRINITY_DN10412_c0_g1~~TRINITY_DN10412_c0_g1_i1.p1  ORF type:complete len:210 (+),score=40.51 TRINITY_DN10412_c0_g1_i1:81-710(+)